MAGLVEFAGDTCGENKDVFSGAAQESSDADFGTVGINFRARRPVEESEWHEALATLNCEVPG